MQIEAVVFDIGNVLIEWNPERFFDREIGPERRKRLFSEVDLAGLNEQVDMGDHFTETFHGAAKAHPAWQTEILMWHDRWIEMASPEIPHSSRLLRALRAKGVPVFALSNFGVQTFDQAAEHYPVLREFDRSYISGHVRMMKPDPAFYGLLERDSGVDPGALLFADDRPENIEMAHARGWQGHLFEHPQGWADTLVAHGLLTAEHAT